MPASQNIERLETVALALGERLSEVAFVGGAVVELYVTDSAAPPVRSTSDVDCVIPARTRMQMQRWERTLRGHGFRNDMEQGAPICRWIHGDTIVDVMPVDQEALGFTNPWYESALQHTIPYKLPSGTTIRLLELPWYVATKVAAIGGRGGPDYRFSHDFEDVIYLWDCIPDFKERILQAPRDIRYWLGSEIRRWKDRPNLREEVESALEAGSTRRVQRILTDISIIAATHRSGQLRKPDVKIATAATVTLEQLESHLWESANILRGPVDAADFKSYIFPLLFLKRICDVWDEEWQEIVDETGDEDMASYPESHRFQIPEGSHWDDVRSRPSNVGSALQRAMREIEKLNPETLYGVFGDAQWSNKDRLSDALLKDLLEHFSKLPLGNQNVDSDILGDAYEYLIKKFADATNKKAGEFYTPRSVVRLMVDILDPKETDTIYDPACGTGGMLLAAVQHVKERHGNVKRLWGKLFGQEKNLTTSSIARMNLFLHGIEDFRIERGDTLRNPAFFDGDLLSTFDCVIANPPFSLEKWGEDQWESDPYGRNFAGTPPSSSGDFAWVQHMVKSMAPKTGRLAVVLPQGTLFRKGAEGEIRRKLLEMDLVEAVIGLAPNLFYGTGLAACILILRQKKAVARRKKVLIVDASRLFRKGRAQNFLETEHAQEILGWVERFEDVQDSARVVGLDEIKSEGWTLNISRYVLPPLQEDIPPLPEAIAAFKDALQRCREAEERLTQVMENGGWLEDLNAV